MTRSKILRAIGTVLSRTLPNVHTTAEVTSAADRVRDRDDCRGRASDYACGLEDGAVTVVYEIGITDTTESRHERIYPEPGWATDQTK